jgi:YidC/Oxa1 family membrane protein insertase
MQQQLTSAQPAPVPLVNQPQRLQPAVVAGAKDVIVETDMYTAVFNTCGGTLKKLVLKKYMTSTAPDAKPIALIDEETPGSYSLQTLGTGIPVDPAALYNVNADSLQVKRGEKKSLEFVASVQDGALIKKIYTFTGEGYVIGLDQQIDNNGATPLQGNLQLVEKNRYAATAGRKRYDVHGPTTFADNSVHALSSNDLAKGPELLKKCPLERL